MAAEPPRAPVRGLLDQITATSLDEDYAAAAARRAGAGGESRSPRPGTWGLVALAVFGVMVATAAVHTSRNAELAASSRQSLVAQANARKEVLADRRREVSLTRAELVEAQARDVATRTTARELRERNTRLGLLAGSVPAVGPGVRVVVDDAPGADTPQERVQAPDLQKLVNGLWQVGAEAVAINGQRLTVLSPIREAAGAVTVNFRSLRPPYTVSAVGDPDTMAADLLDTRGGQVWVTLQSTFGLQFDVDTQDSMQLPQAKPVTLRSAQARDTGTPDKTGNRDGSGG